MTTPKQQPVAADLTEDQRQARAFGEYLKDCDKHAIQTDTASAFLWGWNAALGSAPDTPVPTYESVRDAASAVYEAHMAATPVPAAGPSEEQVHAAARAQCNHECRLTGSDATKTWERVGDCYLQEARFALSRPVACKHHWVGHWQAGYWCKHCKKWMSDSDRAAADGGLEYESWKSTATPVQPVPASEPVAYSVGRTLHWHEGRGITDAQLYATPVPVVREFTNELGNAIRITIEGPTSVSENILTPMEVDELRKALATPVPASEPFGYYVYVPAEQRGEFVFDLDEALDDLTNCECDVTELRASAPATQDKGEGA